MLLINQGEVKLNQIKFDKPDENTIIKKKIEVPELILGILQLGYVIMDFDGKIIFKNQKILEILNIPNEGSDDHIFDRLLDLLNKNQDLQDSKSQSIMKFSESAILSNYKVQLNQIVCEQEQQ